MTKVTVAICTWNRADLLDQTLARMRELHVPGGVDWELLVVNNNCTDHTDQVITRHSNALPVRRLAERKPGLSNARNCAVAAARGDLLIWTDDDVLADQNWLAEYIRAARDWPEAAFFGGQILPWFSKEPPIWIRQNIDLLQGPFAIADYGSRERWLEPDEIPVGANMAFRTETLRQYTFDASLGHIAGQVRGGEELSMVQNLSRHGLRGVWVPSARVEHWIEPARLTRRYIWKWYRGAGQALRCHAAVQEVSRAFGVPRWALRQYVTSLVKSWLVRPISSRASLTAMIEAAKAAGVIVAARQESHTGAASTKPSLLSLSSNK